MIGRLIDGICRVFGFAMVLCLALMVVMVFGNVVLRYGFNSGLTMSEELSRWLFVWLTFLGAIVALRKHSHLGTDMVVARLPRAGRKACFVAAHLIMLSMCWLMGRGAWQQTVINLDTRSAVMQVSMGAFYATGVVFAVLATLILLHEVCKLAAGQLDEAQLVAVIESEEVAHAEAGDAGPVRR